VADVAEDPLAWGTGIGRRAICYDLATPTRGGVMGASLIGPFTGTDLIVLATVSAVLVTVGLLAKRLPRREPGRLADAAPGHGGPGDARMDAAQDALAGLADGPLSLGGSRALAVGRLDQPEAASPAVEQLASTGLKGFQGELPVGLDEGGTPVERLSLVRGSGPRARGRAAVAAAPTRATPAEPG
jgi:hypothetical protein